jgi:outer membrane protein TolC
MGVPVWLLGGGAGIIGVALGFWSGEAERERLRKAVAAREKAVQEREAALEKMEQALAEKERETEQRARELSEQLHAVQQPEKAVRQKRASVHRKVQKKLAKGAVTIPGTPRQEEL